MSRSSMSTTGDVQNNIEKLRQELLHCKYSALIDTRALRNGNPADLLPFIHWAMLGFSTFLHDYLVGKGHDLFTKTDMRFMEEVFKILRHEFDYQPQLRVDQFFVDGFAERKVILVHDIVKLCQRKHLELKREVKKHSHDKASTRSSHSRASTSPARALVRNVAAGARISPSVPVGLQPKIVFEGGSGTRVVRVVDDNEEAGLPRTMGPPPPLPMTTSNVLQARGAKDEQTRAGGETDEWMDGDEDLLSDIGDGFEQIPISQGESVPARVSKGPRLVGGGAEGATMAQIEAACYSLHCKVESILSRLGSLEERVAALDDVKVKADSVEEECAARLLLAEGKIRFLEHKVTAMEASGTARGGQAGSAGEMEGEGRELEGRESRVIVAMVSQQGQLSSPSMDFRPSPSGGRQGSTASPAAAGKARGGQMEGGGGGAEGDKENLPSGHRVAPPWQREEGAGEGEAKLNAFISGIKERFRQTQQLLDDAEPRG